MIVSQSITLLLVFGFVYMLFISLLYSSSASFRDALCRLCHYSLPFFFLLFCCFYCFCVFRPLSGCQREFVIGIVSCFDSIFHSFFDVIVIKLDWHIHFLFSFFRLFSILFLFFLCSYVSVMNFLSLLSMNRLYFFLI